MRLRKVATIGVIGILGLTGCGSMKERRWGACAVGGGVLGALAGAGTAGGLVEGYESGGSGASATDTETAIAAGSGALVGALLGTLLGHALCDPVEAAPPPPPPPPAPAPAPPPPAARKTMTLSADTYFDFDKATLKPGGEDRIDEILPALKEDPKKRVLVEGHTDSVGSEQYNQGLSERRADAVARYLASQGISMSRIETRGYGESKPVASNSTAEGRAQNRRVEITTE